MKEKPLILITNDDGYKSKGIIELAKAAKNYGDVVIAAPMFEQSSTGRAMSVRKEIKIKKIDDYAALTYAIDATPATCIAIAVNGGLLNKKPDLVLSGINNGENLSSSITLSGTIGAAIEAASYNIPSIAFSLQRPKNLAKKYAAFDKAGDISSKFIKKILNEDLGSFLLNINMPYCANIDTAVIETKISEHNHYPTRVTREGDNYVVSLIKSYEGIKEGSDADIVINKKCISVTSLDYLIGK